MGRGRGRKRQVEAAAIAQSVTRREPTLARFRRVIARVPRGKVITYGQVADAAGFPGGARLTVRALQSSAELPWHRVVAAHGRIALAGEEGREQRLRLALEGVTFRGACVRMERHNWLPAARRAGSRRSSRPVRFSRPPPRSAPR